MKHSIRLIAFAVAAVSVASISSCNTTRGIGQDIQKAGHSISTTATRTGGTGTR